MTNYASRRRRGIYGRPGNLRTYSRSNYNRPGNWGVGAIVALIIVAVVALCAWGFYTTQLKTSTVTFTVQSKERIAEGNSGGKYLVFSTANEAYQVTDNILFGKTDSSNRYAALREGTTYECEAVGVRFSLFSMYKNLIECKVVTE
jgi:hypothetical protein